MKVKLLVPAFAVVLISTASQAGDVSVSGFLSVGGGKVDDLLPPCDPPTLVTDCAGNGAAASNHGYTEDKWTFDNDTIFGLQISAQVSDKVTATGQFIAKGAEDFELDAEWAYISFQATDNLKLRAGRFVIPFYLYSDFRNVGYALPWIRAPQAVYSLAFNSTNGVDFIWTPSLGYFDATIQGYTGSNNFTAPALGNADMETRKGMGLSLTLNRDWFTFRIASHKADVSLNGDQVVLPTGVTLNQFSAATAQAGFPANARLLQIQDDEFTFDEMALSVDTGRFLAVAEMTELRSDTFYRGSDRTLLMLGYRHSDWLFHVTAGDADDPVQEDMTAGIPVITQTEDLREGLDAVSMSVQRVYSTMTYGVRWDFTPSVAFKFELEFLDDDRSDKSRLMSFAIQSVF